MNKLCLAKKIFFMKEIFFSFTKYFLVLGKLFFFLISKNLTAEANTIKWRCASAKASAFADCRGEFRTL